LPSAPAQTAADADSGWPQELDAGRYHFAIYEPQVDQWKKDHLQARAAVTLIPTGTSTSLYGIVALTARTDVNKESRMVTLEDLKVSSVSFPAAKSQEAGLERAIRDSVPQWPRTITLDRLLADLAMTQAEGENESIAVKNEPPKILYSTTPAVLIVVDGQPVLRSLQGTPFQHVINTPATLLYDTSTSRYYLDGSGVWMTASTLDGPWTSATNPPPSLDQAKAQVDQTEEKDPHDHITPTSTTVGNKTLSWRGRSAQLAALVSHGSDSRATYTLAATGRFGNIARTDGISRTTTATGRDPNPRLGSKVSASRAHSANPARMNFAVSDRASVAVCREQLRRVSEHPEAAAGGEPLAHSS
jgi:hypothetical protein